ncbi:hypothetical protein ABFS82_03G114100 [Erythranthe guttata]
MASISTHLHIVDDDDEFDWEAAVQEIDVACQATNAEKPTFISNFNCGSEIKSNPVQEVQKKRKFDSNFSSVSSTRQSTLDRFVGFSSSSKKSVQKVEFSNGFFGNTSNSDSIGHKNVVGCEDTEMLDEFVKIDAEAAKTWIYPVNIPRRDYQFSITRTALFSNTLVVLPTGLGKTLIAAVVMYNYFRWFPQGKIVFAAPSRPLVMQQIEACHKIVGIPQEYTIDLTGQTSPTKRAEFWKSRRVFFVTPQVLEKDIHSGSCLVKHLVCLVIDEAHRAMGNFAYCGVVRELMDTSVQLRILALTATPGAKQQTIQHVINNLQISTLEYRDESDPDVLRYVHERKIELIEVAMGDEAVEINNLLLKVIHPLVGRLRAFGLLQNRDIQTMSPHDFLISRDRFRQEPPQDLPHIKYGEIEGYFGVLITLYHIRKLLSSHGIRPAFEMLDEKIKQGCFARHMSRNEDFLKAKLLMQQTLSHGAPSPKLAKMLEVLIGHFKMKDPQHSRVIIFSNFRGSVRDILNALTDIGDFVKATEFIGQSAGKTLKGQSQKIQQAVLQKFRTGGYNVIVATSIGEEGLDIMEVDLVICFDANVSPLRMIQRMGRTGRKHEGRVVVLACEGSEMKGYTRKLASSKTVTKHMRNGGMNSFNFHPSPRMVPHLFKPEVQFLEMSIKEFVPRGNKLKDNVPVSVPGYKTELTDSETGLLAKYFKSTSDTWIPSLTVFPHFQAFPSPVNKVLHSSRTGFLIDTMQYLQGLTFDDDSKTFSAEHEDISEPCVRVEEVEPHEEIIEDSENFGPAEEKLETEVPETEIEFKKFAKDIDFEDFDKQKPCLHAPLFGSEFVSIDDVGNVQISSLPELPLQFNAKCTIDDNMVPEYLLVPDSEDHEEDTVHDANGKDEDEDILNTPISSRMPKEKESSNDIIDCELSPRLTNFIESGVVPESPIHSSGPWNGGRGNFAVPALVSSPNLETEFSVKSLNLEDKPLSVSKEMQTPKLSNSSNSKDWLFDSGVRPETVEQQCKFRRLRKLGDVKRNIPSESRERTGPSRKHGTSRGTHDRRPAKLVKGEKKRANDAVLYIDEEAEVSPEIMASDDEEDEPENSSYEDSFIDDGTNTAATSTQACDSRTDMMAIYRRSLLSQSPFQRFPNFDTKSSPDSVVQSSRIDESGSSSGTKNDDAKTRGCFDSTAMNSQFTLDSRKRKLSFHQTAQSVPVVNLNQEFLLIAEAACEKSSMQRQEERTEENIDIFEDDQFYEGIDLDAIEEEAAKLLRQKTECLTPKTATLPEPIEQNLAILGSPSFDLGF